MKKDVPSEAAKRKREVVLLEPIRITVDAKAQQKYGNKSDLGLWRQEAAKRHKERSEAIAENLPAIEEKFRLMGGFEGVGIMHREKTFAERILILPFEILPGLIRSGISVDEQPPDLCRRLAHDILNDMASARVVVLAVEHEIRAEQEHAVITSSEMNRIGTEAGFDMTTFSYDASLPPEMHPIYLKMTEESSYLSSIGRIHVKRKELLIAFNSWRTGEIPEASLKLGAVHPDLIHEYGGLYSHTDSFVIHTSQEADALIRSASDGKRGTHWRNEVARECRVWEHNSLPHHVEIPLDGYNWDALEGLTGDQNGDFSLALFYIAGVVCPPPDSGLPVIGRAWLDLNDVMEKIGWLREKPNAAKKEQLRRALWRFLVYGEEARVVGARSVPYFDKTSGKTIPTYIESPVWKILDKQFPEQRELFDELKPSPIGIEIAVSLQFQRIFSDRSFAQYMPLGELLGAIPPNKVGGDWARVIGLTLAYIWRCKPREAKTEMLQIKRRDILTHYVPKTQSVEEILSGSNPKRAVDYYREALNILLEIGLIAPVGDAAKEITPAKMLEPYGRKGWGEKWLNGITNLRPGPEWEPIVIDRANSRPPLKARDLSAKKQHRPRKKRPS